ncbi:hypothetical protein D039_0072A, partial [Vibrio parahaemolyticus EKP-028]
MASLRKSIRSWKDHHP